MLPGIGPTEMIVIAVVALLVLGPKRLPDAGRGLGRGLREFKSAVTGDRTATTASPDDAPAPTLTGSVGSIENA